MKPLLTELAGDGAEDAGAPRVAARRPPARWRCCRSGRSCRRRAARLLRVRTTTPAHDRAGLDLGRRERLLDGGDDDVADLGVAAVAAAEHLDGAGELRAGVVGHVQPGAHLDHEDTSGAAASAAVGRRARPSAAGGRGRGRRPCRAGTRAPPRRGRPPRGRPRRCGRGVQCFVLLSRRANAISTVSPELRLAAPRRGPCRLTYRVTYLPYTGCFTLRLRLDGDGLRHLVRDHDAGHGAPGCAAPRLGLRRWSSSPSSSLLPAAGGLAGQPELALAEDASGCGRRRAGCGARTRGRSSPRCGRGSGWSKISCRRRLTSSRRSLDVAATDLRGLHHAVPPAHEPRPDGQLVRHLVERLARHVLGDAAELEHARCRA